MSYNTEKVDKPTKNRRGIDEPMQKRTRAGTDNQEQKSTNQHKTNKTAGRQPTKSYNNRREHKIGGEQTIRKKSTNKPKTNKTQPTKLQQ
jgi:hypothetical protein